MQGQNLVSGIQKNLSECSKSRKSNIRIIYFYRDSLGQVRGQAGLLKLLGTV